MARAATPDDTAQGKGNSNLARTAQAKALVAFSTAQQAAQGTDKVLLMGNFNSYSFEDPMLLMADAGYVDLGAKTGKQSYALADWSVPWTILLPPRAPMP